MCKVVQWCCRLWTPAPGPSPEAVFDMKPHEAVIHRLKDQLAWYDRKAAVFQQRHKLLKTIALIAASAVPLFAIADGDIYVRSLTATLGVIVAVCEGIQQMNQYQQNWIAYRAVAEALKHEMYMFTARIGHYAGTDEDQRHDTLARTVESLISAEHAKWVANQAASGDKNGKAPPAEQPPQEPATPPAA